MSFEGTCHGPGYADVFAGKKEEVYWSGDLNEIGDSAASVPFVPILNCPSFLRGAFRGWQQEDEM